MGVISTSVDILKRVALMGFIITALVAVGTLINGLIPWFYLSYLFGFFRLLLSPIDFMVDSDTLLSLVGLSIFVDASFWSVKGLFSLLHLVGWNK